MQVGGGPADGENVFHRNITNPLPDNMASHWGHGLNIHHCQCLVSCVCNYMFLSHLFECNTYFIPIIITWKASDHITISIWVKQCSIL
jgi:hypothetical protein